MKPFQKSFEILKRSIVEKCTAIYYNILKLNLNSIE